MQTRTQDKRSSRMSMWLAAGALYASLGTVPAIADTYQIDTRGMHAAIEFKVKHLGYSWLSGRFDKFDGTFEYDAAKPENSKINVHIDVSSLDSNHAERDKHLRSPRFFDTSNYPDARFKSNGVEMQPDGSAIIKGDFTLRGVTRPIIIKADLVGQGKDPWGGYRAGFTGTTTLHLSDYKMKEAGILGTAAENIQVILNIEGVRQ